MQPDSTEPWTLSHMPSSSLLSAFQPLPLKCTLGSTEHSWIHYVQFLENQGSWGYSWEVGNRIKRINAFPFFLSWRLFDDVFLKASWKVPKGTRKLERARVIVWACYSWLHCVKFYNKDKSSSVNRLVFKQRSKRLKWELYNIESWPLLDPQW